MRYFTFYNQLFIANKSITIIIRLICLLLSYIDNNIVDIGIIFSIMFCEDVNRF